MLFELLLLPIIAGIETIQIGFMIIYKKVDQITYAYQVPMIQMFKILETQFMRVMGIVNGIHVPRDFFSKWQRIIVAHT